MVCFESDDLKVPLNKAFWVRVSCQPLPPDSVVLRFSDTTLELSVMPKDEDILQVVSFLQIEIVL